MKIYFKLNLLFSIILVFIINIFSASIDHEKNECDIALETSRNTEDLKAKSAFSEIDKKDRYEAANSMWNDYKNVQRELKRVTFGCDQIDFIESRLDLAQIKAENMFNWMKNELNERTENSIEIFNDLTDSSDAFLSLTDDKEYTPLTIAFLQKNSELSLFLINKSSQDQLNLKINGFTPLALSIVLKLPILTRQLIRRRVNMLETYMIKDHENELYALELARLFLSDKVEIIKMIIMETKRQAKETKDMDIIEEMQEIISNK